MADRRNGNFSFILLFFFYFLWRMNSHGERGREGVFINWESFKSSETTVERLLLLFFFFFGAFIFSRAG